MSEAIKWKKGVKTCEFCGKLSADIGEHPCFIAHAAGRDEALKLASKIVVRIERALAPDFARELEEALKLSAN